MRYLLSRILSGLGLLNAARCLKRTSVGIWKDLCWSVGGQRSSLYGSISAPPPSLCFAVSANYDVDYFLRTGMQGADSIRRILKRNGRPIEGFNSILDFGCGCGRITRHWAGLEGPSVTGTDINPRLISWARKNLAFGRFLMNCIDSRLPFGDGEFDLVYAISVFTHLNRELQEFWIGELSRVLRPGSGTLLITLKGENWKHELDEERANSFDSGKMVVLEPENSGSNYCAAYHPPDYVRGVLAQNLQVLEHEPSGSEDTGQDFYLLAKT